MDFNMPVARNSDPDTAHGAARDAAKAAATGRVLVLLTLLSSVEGLTDFELASRTGWQQTSIGKRRGECRDAGLVESTPLRRPAPSGSPAIVWRLTADGAAYAQRCRSAAEVV